MSARRSIGRRVFDALLRWLPADFRVDFGDAMSADVDAAGQQGASFWSREIFSVLVAIVREHLDVLRQDVRYSVRMLRRTPGFSATAVLMLALGTGANVAIFSIVDAVLLRSPFRDPSRVVALLYGPKDRATWAVPVDRYRSLVEASGPLAAVAAFGSGMHVLTGRGEPQNVDDVECFDAAMFEVLGTPPLVGRTFGPADDRPGAEPTIVLSYRFWQELGGSPDILGSTITLNHTAVTVIGVMPDGFAGPLARGDVPGWVPRSRPVTDDGNVGCRQTAAVNLVARVRSGVSPAAAGLALPDGFQIAPLESPNMDDVRTPLAVLMAAVVCVLLIACFNVGGLQMERSLARRREIALRQALGASGGRLVRQTLTENLILAFAGAAAGVLATRLTLGALVSRLPGYVPYLDQIAVSRRVLGLAIAAATAAGLVAGLLPLVEMRRMTPARDLGDVTRASERRGGWGRRALVVSEIALSVVVLVGAALMIQTFLILRPAHPGFEAEHKLFTTVRLRGSSPAENAQFFPELLARLRAVPGIRGAEGTTYFPMSGNTAMAAVEIGGATRDMFANYASPGFFSLLHIPLVEGRMFTDADTSASDPVVIVNAFLAARIRPDGHVVGQRVVVRSQGPGEPPIARTIVGVLANTRTSLASTRIREELYIPFAQHPVSYQWVFVDATPGGEADAASRMRAEVRALRPDLAVTPPRSLTSFFGERLATTQFGASALGVLAVLAVSLAAIGLMATIGWWVRQRTRELGVRIALGATRGTVTTLVLQQGLVLAAAGVVLGAAMAAAVTRYLAGWIFGVTPLDPATFAASAGLMLAVACAAVYLPVRRATSVDPVIALRAE